MEDRDSAPAASTDPDLDVRGSDTPTRTEMKDPGAHDRGGWLTLDEAARQFGEPRYRLEAALHAGQMSGRPLVGEVVSPKDAPAESVAPEGGTAPAAEAGLSTAAPASAPAAYPTHDWLVQPDQVEAFLENEGRNR